MVKKVKIFYEFIPNKDVLFEFLDAQKGFPLEINEVFGATYLLPNIETPIAKGNWPNHLIGRQLMGEEVLDMKASRTKKKFSEE